MDSVKDSKGLETLKANREALKEKVARLELKSPKTDADMLILEVTKQQVWTLNYFINQEGEQAKQSWKSKLLNLIKNAKEKIR